jgi:hypothetical protein
MPLPKSIPGVRIILWTDFCLVSWWYYEDLSNLIPFTLKNLSLHSEGF